jgi:predicted metal-dependent enzyme (double-stranded beta helix superfamily)
MRASAALDGLVDAARSALDAGGGEPAVVAAIRPAMAELLGAAQPLPAAALESLSGAAVGNLLHADPVGRFHILSVVFPEGTSSGIHHHGCWGVIGYLKGGDEEVRYRPSDGDERHVVLTETRRRVWRPGDISELLPPDEAWHRVRNPGPGDGVSVHVLCRTPADHPHRYWDPRTGAVHPFPFVEAAPGRWRAEVQW